MSWSALVLALTIPSAAGAGIAASPAQPVVAVASEGETFMNILGDADLALKIAGGNACRNRFRQRLVRRQEDRMWRLIGRAELLYGDQGHPLTIVDPLPDGWRCDWFQRSLRNATRTLDRAEAYLSAREAAARAGAAERAGTD